MRRSTKSRQGISQSSIAIMADVVKAKEQNLSYGKYKALGILGAGSMMDEDAVSEYAVHEAALVRRNEQSDDRKAVAFVKIRA